MIRFGLPNESIEPSNAFGQILVSVDETTSVVTFVWGSNVENNYFNELYTVLSTCYDSKVCDGHPRREWLATFLHLTHDWTQQIYEINTTLEPFVAQALAFSNIEKLRRGPPKP